MMNHFLSYSFALLVLLILSATGQGADAESKPLLEVNWQQLAEAGELSEGELVTDERQPQSVLKVSGSDEPVAPGVPLVINVAEIVPPTIETQAYVISGQVRYRDVEGIGYLEMWSYFPDGTNSFTRTLGTGGTMGRITRTSDWRAFHLPFSLGNNSDAQRPNKLVINVVLPGKGTVWLSDFALSEIDSLADLNASGSWWSGSMAGWIGGLLGTLLGIAGATGGVLASRGIGRNAVFAATIVGIAVGLLMTACGVVAVLLGQPYGVYYPLMLIGGLSLVLSTCGLVLFRKRYAEAELRRMHALDAGG